MLSLPQKTDADISGIEQVHCNEIGLTIFFPEYAAFSLLDVWENAPDVWRYFYNEVNPYRLIDGRVYQFETVKENFNE